MKHSELINVELPASAQPTTGASSPPSWPSPLKGEGTLDSSTIRGKENQIFSPNKGKKHQIFSPIRGASDCLSHQGGRNLRFSPSPLVGEGRGEGRAACWASCVSPTYDRCFFTPILAFPHQGGRNIRFIHHSGERKSDFISQQREKTSDFLSH